MLTIMKDGTGVDLSRAISIGAQGAKVIIHIAMPGGWTSTRVEACETEGDALRYRDELIGLCNREHKRAAADAPPFDEETAQVLCDAKAGKNPVRYSSFAEFVKDLDAPNGSGEE